MADPSSTPPPADLRAIARQVADATTFNTLVPAFEERLLIVAEGIEFHKDQMRAANAARGVPDKTLIIPDYLQDKLGADVNVASDGTITFASLPQRVNFTVRFVTTKPDYKAALETAGAHVIYNGHARFGRGPCFGDDPTPGNQWGNGTSADPGTCPDGIFRFGFPFLAVPLSEILEHGYFADPVSGDDPIPPRAECHPDIRGHYSSLRRVPLRTLSSRPATSARVVSLLSVTGDPDETYWSYHDFENGRREPFIVMHADWQNSATAPLDLGGTDLQCRVLCHFGCSSFLHNFPVLRKLRGWTRTEDDRFAFWCTSTSDSFIDARWIHRLFTYPEDNAFQSWKPSLDYAVAHANRDLRNVHQSYQVI